MFHFLWVFLGGGIGSLLRYGIAQSLTYLGCPPVATFLANALSCILLGFLTALSLKTDLDQNYRLFLMTGLCGGFSTFSTFTNETYQLFQNGEFVYALVNIFGSVLLCLFCIFIGMKMAGLLALSD
ncbi:MAG: fluoride efflux transporter CrcB [Bacteroidota bacterium]